jgi:hypothetical protein
MRRQRTQPDAAEGTAVVPERRREAVIADLVDRWFRVGFLRNIRFNRRVAAERMQREQIRASSLTAQQDLQSLRIRALLEG